MSSDTDSYIVDYTYRNSTIHAVEMIGYVCLTGYDSVFLFFEDKWQIAPVSSVEIRLFFGEVSERPASPMYSDSVRIVFDGSRELIYRGGNASVNEPVGIYDLTRYIETEIDKRHRHYAYVITDDDYEQSVPIADDSPMLMR